MPPEVAYQVVKAVFENFDQFRAMHPALAQSHARGDGRARQYRAVPRGRLALLPGAALAESVTQARRPLPLASLPLTRLELMAAAGREVVAAERALAKQGFNMVGRLLRDEGPFYAWDHYPAGDVFDSRHGAQYFFHAHGGAQRDAGEHGHFHSFVRPVGTGKLHHLVAVSVDHASRPIRLFTVNCWVTEDSWIRAPGRHRAPRSLHPRWAAALALGQSLAGSAAAAVPPADRAAAAAARCHAGRLAIPAWGEDPFIARELEILSELPISTTAQMDSVTRAMAKAERRG